MAYLEQQPARVRADQARLARPARPARAAPAAATGACEVDGAGVAVRHGLPRPVPAAHQDGRGLDPCRHRPVHRRSTPSCRCCAARIRDVVARSATSTPAPRTARTAASATTPARSSRSSPAPAQNDSGLFELDLRRRPPPAVRGRRRDQHVAPRAPRRHPAVRPRDHLRRRAAPALHGPRGRAPAGRRGRARHRRGAGRPGAPRSSCSRCRHDFGRGWQAFAAAPNDAARRSSWPSGGTTSRTGSTGSAWPTSSSATFAVTDRDRAQAVARARRRRARRRRRRGLDALGRRRLAGVPVPEAARRRARDDDRVVRRRLSPVSRPPAPRRRR